MVNSIRVILILILAWFGPHSPIQAQSDSTTTKKVIGGLTSLSRNRSQELVYVQTSKGIYETEEDLWFKAYVLDAQYFDPSNRSKTLYVQLNHENDNRVFWQEKYEIINGFADGHIFLNDSLPIGNYLLTAYTTNSFFRGPDKFSAVRKIKIVRKAGDMDVSSINQHTKKAELINMTLFPEGGNLISGLQGRLAFKVVNGYGNPIDVSGTLYENDKPIVDFSSLHEGMGSMDFVPHADKKYYLKLKENDSTYNLPRIYSQGISMLINEQDSTSISFNISQTHKSREQKIYLRAQLRGVTHFIAEGNLRESLKIKIPLEDLPQGISEVTLFDANFRPIAERLVYLNPNKKLHITATLSDGDEYKTKEKISLKLKVTDDKGRPLVAHLGVSIHDWIYKNNQDPKNIMTHFYLSTQLKGKIHNPGYYFDKENKQRLKALDLLLLTQGWRRYLWSETNLNIIPANRGPVILDEIHGVVINQKKNNHEILNQSVMMAYNPMDEDQKDFVLLDSLGRFALAPKHLKIGERGFVYLKLMVPEKSRFKINLHDTGFKSIDKVRKTKILDYPLTPSNIIGEEDDTTPFRSVPDIVQLKEVEVKTRRRTIYREKYLGKLDSIAKLATSDYVCKYNILNCEYHTNDKENFKPVEGGIYHYVEYLDGNVWRRGHHRLNGAVYFRNPPLSPYRYPILTDAYLLEKFNIVRAKGYYGYKEFYQPDYDEEDSSFADYRNTLLWSPLVITDYNGEANLSFFCSDINTLFLGTIEGVSADGLLGNESFKFTVKKD